MINQLSFYDSFSQENFKKESSGIIFIIYHNRIWKILTLDIKEKKNRYNFCIDQMREMIKIVDIIKFTYPN